MRKGPAHIEIVTPVHNRKSITLQCLRSLSHIDKKGLKTHVIVVDDASTDGTSDEISACFPDVEIIQGDGNLWYAGGTNRGIEAALKHNPHYILAVNDDSIFHDCFLQRLISCAERHPKSVAGALLLLWDRPHAVFQVGARWDTWYGGWRHPRDFTVWTVPKEAFEVEHIVGNCVLYPVEAVREHGLMHDKALAHWGADVEYTIRMRKSGWRLLIEPSAYVWCQPNAVLPPMKTMRLASVLHELFLNSRSPKNLGHIFKARWYTAPSRFLGLTAFGVAVIRTAFHAVGLGGSWPFWADLPIALNQKHQ